jgi:glycosyltransferase involved in cell wall biosynthesis
MLKGYQSWAGRALVGLQALELCQDLLGDYTIAIYLASPEVRKAAEDLHEVTKIPVRIIPHSPHQEILRLHSQARVSIGLSISDAISTSFLEAIAMGSFPIQSHTSCANEWIEDGKSGLLVPPEDADAVAEALRRALTDGVLVDQAAEHNAQIVTQRLDRSVIQPQVVAMYKRIATDVTPR